MRGGFGAADWTMVAIPLLALLGGLGWFGLKARDLNALAMGDETAATLGIAVGRARLAHMIVGALVTGVMVSASGMIGFVGLMTPHMARLVPRRRQPSHLARQRVAGIVVLGAGRHCLANGDRA